MEKITGFKNCNILIDKNIIKTNVIVNRGIIFKIGDYVCDNMIELDDELIVVPGFIDEHIHGANAVDFMDGEKYLNILEDTAKSGVTSVCATTSTNSISNIKKALKNISEYISKNIDMGSRIIGIHLEGPFLSKEYKGAQLDEFIIDSNISVMNEFIKSKSLHSEKSIDVYNLLNDPYQICPRLHISFVTYSQVHLLKPFIDTSQVSNRASMRSLNMKQLK